MINIEGTLQNLINNKLIKGYYDSSDIILVRDTDFLPFDRIVRSISNIPFVCKSTLDANRAIKTILIEKDLKLEELKQEVQNAQTDNIKILQKISDREEEIMDLAKEYTPLATQYRSTVHFCLNGLVSDHGNNIWNGKYVILEPFKYHDKDYNIEAVRPEDTYFKDEIVLSKETIILVDEKDRDEVLSSYINTDYNFVFYSGSKEQAVKEQLIKMQIVPEIIDEHNLRDSKTSDFIKQFILEKGYNTDKHSVSTSYEEDDKKSLVLWEKYQIEFIKYLESFVFNNDLYNKLKTSKNFCSEKVALFIQIINNLGLENYKQIVCSFNKNIIDRILAGNFPTNNEILVNSSLNVFENSILR